MLLNIVKNDNGETIILAVANENGKETSEMIILGKTQKDILQTIKDKTENWTLED